MTLADVRLLTVMEANKPNHMDIRMNFRFELLMQSAYSYSNARVDLLSHHVSLLSLGGAFFEACLVNYSL
jgi:hypothetical protein